MKLAIGSAVLLLLCSTVGCAQTWSTLTLDNRHGLVYTYDPGETDRGFIAGPGGVVLPDVPFWNSGRVLVLETDTSFAILYATPEMAEGCVEVWWEGRSRTSCFDFPLTTSDGLTALSADRSQMYMPMLISGPRLPGLVLLATLTADGVVFEEVDFPAQYCPDGDEWVAPICFDFAGEDDLTIYDCDIATRACEVGQTIRSSSMGDIMKVGPGEYVVEVNDGEFCIATASEAGLTRLACEPGPTVLLGALGSLDRGEVFVEVIDDAGFTLIRQLSLRRGVLVADRAVAERAVDARLAEGPEGPVLVYNEMSRVDGDLLARHRRLPIMFPDAEGGEE